MVKIINRKPKVRSHTLREICEERKNILIKREVGGLGDILMHRMIFEDFKLLMPDVKITFACPHLYHPALTDHPFIDQIADCRTVNETDYIVHYITTHICSRYEMSTSPHVDKSRPDIWAEHCGVKLTKHNMHISLSEQERDYAQKTLQKMNPDGKPTVLVSTISAMLNKNLEAGQIEPVIDELRKRNYYVFMVHTIPITNINIPCLYNLSIRQWMSIVEAADYTVSVDTATFHCAGGMGKPVVGVFAWTDSKLYSQYYPKVELVQQHRDYTPGWTCGPCFDFNKCNMCPSATIRKPCITSITSDMILGKFDSLVDKYPICHIQ